MTEEKVAIARDQIRALLAHYNNNGDRGRIEDLASVFAPDGVLEFSGQRFEGRAAIEAELSAVSTGGRAEINLAGSRHNITTSRIDFEAPNRALGWTYFFVSRQGRIIEEGTYIDDYVRLAEGWRIAHRRVKTLFAAYHEG
jgi:uncharacterized protein (TIGR02246 family)